MTNRSAITAGALLQHNARINKLHRELIELHRKDAINTAFDKEIAANRKGAANAAFDRTTAVNTTANKETSNGAAVKNEARQTAQKTTAVKTSFKQPKEKGLKASQSREPEHFRIDTDSEEQDDKNKSDKSQRLSDRFQIGEASPTLPCGHRTKTRHSNSSSTKKKMRKF